MKLAILINGLGKGGAERVACSLAEHFHKEGHDVLLVTSRVMPEEYAINPAIPRRLLEEEIGKCRSVRMLGKIPAIGKVLDRMLRIPKRPSTLRKIWMEEKPDVILSFIGKMNLYAIQSAKGLPAKVYVSVRSDPAREYPTALMERLANRSFPKADGVILQTTQGKAFFDAAVQQKCIVLPNALNPEFIKPRYEGARDEEIVMVGRLDANKNHAMVIRAFAEILPVLKEKKEGALPALTIYGGGLLDGSDTRPMLEELVSELQLQDNVRFMGRQSGIREKIEKAKVFVLASGFEGMPNALLEAMAAGLCVISTDCPCGGPAEVIHSYEAGKTITNENGFLIPVGDKEALKKALLEAFLHPEVADALGRNAACIQEVLEPAKVYKQWEDLLFSQE